MWKVVTNREVEKGNLAMCIAIFSSSDLSSWLVTISLWNGKPTPTCQAYFPTRRNVMKEMVRCGCPDFICICVYVYMLCICVFVVTNKAVTQVEKDSLVICIAISLSSSLSSWLVTLSLSPSLWNGKPLPSCKAYFPAIRGMFWGAGGSCICIFVCLCIWVWYLKLYLRNVVREIDRWVDIHFPWIYLYLWISVFANLCICVFVYLYLCICIHVFVFVECCEGSS